jgi:heme exporter protein D
LHWASLLVGFIFSLEKRVKNGLSLMFNFAFTSLQDFLTMNGHGIYVWSVYSITLVIIAISFQVTRHKLRVLKKKLQHVAK